jgi:glyoxylase-like metal-dependent hydrolase (beta-lactamase superfamily II)
MQAIPYICSTCGVQYPPAAVPPERCPICEDDRQYVNPAGQLWTTMQAVNSQHKNLIELITPNLYAIYTTPPFAIAQRAHLLVTHRGNILWDCITNLDASTVDLINKIGGIKAIAISHPHYFSTIVEWSRAFNAPVFINAFDEEWLQQKDESIILWKEQEKELWNGIKLVRCGGHFPGGCVLHWPEGKALLVGDVIQVAPDLKTVSFMYSYPNMIPLPKRDILQIKDAVKDLEYDAMYGAFGRYIRTKAKEATEFSINRYLNIFE